MKALKFVCAVLLLGACNGDDDATTIDAAPTPDAEQQQFDAAPQIDADEPDATATDIDAAPEGDLVINEVDGNGTPDWVELYNGTNDDIDLSTFYLGDNTVPVAAEVLTGTIAKGTYKVLLKDTDFTFGLGKSADSVILYSDNGITVVDSVTWAQDFFSAAGTTYGRSPDGTGDFVMMTPSQGVVNVAP